jgi:hypothetical protein
LSFVVLLHLDHLEVREVVALGSMGLKRFAETGDEGVVFVKCQIR